jgi:magnesium chelatase subunit D
MIIEASKAYLPKGILDSLMEQQKVVQTQENSQGKVGQLKKGLQRGQSLPSRQGKLDRSKKIDLLKTIQAASPWQTIRRQELGISRDLPKIMIRAEDIYLKRYVMRSTSVTLFVVDASGSSALERLGEAKGAVELLLAQCYIRRDQVAMMTFRANQVNLILTPTRSLVRAKRLLAAMPGGGGTPLASAIQTSTQFATQLKRKGQTPVLVLMTDGRANVTAAGVGGREEAYADALIAAQRAKNENLNILFVDTSFKTQEANQIIAKQMGAKYILLPQGKSSAVVEAAKQLVV